MTSTRPIRKFDLTVRDIGSKTLLYNTTEEVLHILNPTAQFIWELCDGEHTIADIEQAIRANFSVSTGHNVRRDIQQMLAIFADKGLLQRLT